MKTKKKKVIWLKVKVTVEYDKVDAMRHAVSTIKRELGMQVSTAGDGWAVAKTGRATEMKEEKNECSD